MNKWGRKVKSIAYTFVFCFIVWIFPTVSVMAADTPAKGVLTEDKVLEMASVTSSLNKGDSVELTFAIHNTDTTGFMAYFMYDTEVFDTLDAGDLTPTDYAPDTEENTGSWAASYNPYAQMIEVRFKGDNAKAMTLPEDKAVVLKMRLTVKKSTEATTVRLDHPKVFKSNENNDGIDYPKGLALTIKNSNTKKITLATKDVTVNNQLVTIPVSFSANDGFASLDLVTEFDKTKLQYQSIAIEAAYRNMITIVSYSTEQNGAKIITHIKTSQEVKNTGVIFNVNFIPVKNNGTQQNTAVSSEVKISLQEVKNQQESAFVTNTVSSKVSVPVEQIFFGDINGNKKVDLVDALYIVQFYNKVRYLNDDQKKSADVNKNGTVDLVDALLIMQYYNGVIKAFP